MVSVNCFGKLFYAIKLLFVEARCYEPLNNQKKKTIGNCYIFSDNCRIISHNCNLISHDCNFVTIVFSLIITSLFLTYSLYLSIITIYDNCNIFSSNSESISHLQLYICQLILFLTITI